MFYLFTCMFAFVASVVIFTGECNIFYQNISHAGVLFGQTHFR